MKFHKTAISRKNMSQPIRHLLGKGYINESVFDYGCGRGKDVFELRELGFTASGYDKFTEIEEFRTNNFCKYHTVTCNYVFNVIEDKEELRKAFEGIMDKKAHNGRVFISVRADKKAVKDSWEKKGDGWVTPRGTFQRFYDDNSIQDLARELGAEFNIIKSNSTYILFEVVA